MGAQQLHLFRIGLASICRPGAAHRGAAACMLARTATLQRIALLFWFARVAPGRRRSGPGLYAVARSFAVCRPGIAAAQSDPDKLLHLVAFYERLSPAVPALAGACRGRRNCPAWISDAGRHHWCWQLGRATRSQPEYTKELRTHCGCFFR